MTINFKEEFHSLKTSNLYRELSLTEDFDGRTGKVNGKEAVIFSSNDYLGLSHSNALKEAAIDAVTKYGTGSTASRLITGNNPAHTELEEELKKFKSVESALLFNSGYQANLSLITTLADRETEIFSDKLNHASIIDGCILSRAKLIRYRHRDFEHLEELLQNSNAENKIVITEGIFSMDGDIAPVNDIAYISNKYNAQVIVDDAHGIGAIGKNGRGVLDALNIKTKKIIEVVTFGKAMGSFGAAVTGSSELRELLINKARPFIYTTALPPAVCAATTRALKLIDEEDGMIRRGHLWDNSTTLRVRLNEEGFDTAKSHSYIIPIIIGDNKKTVELSKKLLNDGFYVQAIREPTVPKNTARLRICVSALHTKQDLEGLISALKKHTK